jgi:hypothetical protein
MIFLLESFRLIEENLRKFDYCKGLAGDNQTYRGSDHSRVLLFYAGREYTSFGRKTNTYEKVRLPGSRQSFAINITTSGDLRKFPPDQRISWITVSLIQHKTSRIFSEIFHRPQITQSQLLSCNWHHYVVSDHSETLKL